MNVLETLGSRRFLFVTGKGGVGKTTVSAALATALASRGKRVLVALCNAEGERLSAVLGTKPIGPNIERAMVGSTKGSGVWTVNLEPERALEEYGRMVLRVGAVADTVFDNKYTRAFFRATPGLFEWAMLGKAWFHTTEREADGSQRFDLVILDAPATGHGLDMLRVPKVILEVVPPGVLRRDAERAWELFRDSSQSGVVVVTIPEDMPTTETIELVTAVRGELGLPVLSLFVNAVLPVLFSEAERERLTSDPSLLDVRAPLTLDARPAGDAALVAAARRAVREGIQQECLERLGRSLPSDVLRSLPALFDLASTVQGTHVLAKRLGEL